MTWTNITLTRPSLGLALPLWSGPNVNSFDWLVHGKSNQRIVGAQRLGSGSVFQVGKFIVWPSPSEHCLKFYLGFGDLPYIQAQAILVSLRVPGTSC